MVGSKPQERKSFGKRVIDQEKTDIDLYGLIRAKISSPQQITVPFSGGGSATTIQGAGSGFLRKEGDIMMGPLAFNPIPLTVLSDTISVDKVTGVYSPRLILLGEGAAPDDLSTISGQMFPGQILNLQAVVTTPITLKDGVGNILTRTGGDIVIGDGQNILLIFDTISGNWTPLDSAAFGSAATGCPVICTENDLGNVSGVTDLDWSIANFHRAVLVGDTTFNIINTPANALWQDICLEVQQDLVGGHLVSFVQGFANNFIPVAILGALRYTSFQIYTYEEPSGTDIFQGFNKNGNNGPQVPGGAGLFQGFAGFIQTVLSSDQTTNIGINDHIEFDTIVDSDTLTVTVGAGQARGIFSGFRPGHTYECEVYISGEGSTNALNWSAQWFDIGGNGFIGTEGEQIANTGVTNRDSQFVGKAFFRSISLADTLEVRITNSTVLTSILNGSSSTEPTTFVTIKDCGVIESVINQPEPAPEDGELDIREFIYQECSTETSAKRFGTFQDTVSFSNVSFIGDPIIRNMRIKAILINVSNKGAGDRIFNVEADGVQRGPAFTIPGGFTGVIEFAPVDIGLDKSELIGWSSQGGASGDRWSMTCVVWYL